MNMLESIARAMHDRACKRLEAERPPFIEKTYDQSTQWVRDSYIDMATAALEALMDRTNGMSGAMIQAGIDANEVPPSGSVCDIFWAMIGAAKEGKMTEFASFEPFVGAPRSFKTDWPIMSMVVFQDRLFVATTNGVYERINNEFVPLKFVFLEDV